MKVKFIYILLFSILTYISSFLYNFLLPFILSLGILYRRVSLILTELLIAILSLIILYTFNKIYIYDYTLRALTLMNLFFILSDYTDRSSILDLLGSKGISVVIALSYYPRFYEMASKVSFYAGIRKISLLNLKRVLLPILVETVKIAENLYIAYTIKLFGKYQHKFGFKPSKNDILFLILGVTVLCLSFLLST
ncbi:hypothetical protein [Saccharolobus caldissimus]|uniref:Cobalt transport protein n=1 Tax=Saccharolobus caldissimus TaxID=1702097 RepID=A0AAQ4CMN2_9CREN|nr:hypothetical protein [Saccharolobus caldissimus]BDB97063.1 hypothetical protein SACC_00800 [Saccharolobus caldissimus]